MCEYLSFMVDLEGEQLRFHGDLMSHSATCGALKLEPDKWRECEWTGERAEDLEIRTHEDDSHNEKWLRACILAKYATRSELENYIADNFMQTCRVMGLCRKGGDRSTLTGGDRSTLTGGYCSTLTGGYGSTLTGGCGSTLTGGYGSTLTGGDRSTLTGGDCSTLTGGYCSTLTGGYGSTLTGGYGSTLTGGYCSTLTGVDRSTLTGGDRSTLIFWGYINDKYMPTVAIIGVTLNIEPGVKYKCDNGVISKAE